MGNEMREKNSSRDHHENGTGGCSWGLLHMIKYNHWRPFMKRVTHHKSRHLLARLGNTGNRTKKPSDDKMQAEYDALRDNSIDGEKSSESLPQRSNSVKARIKSLLPEEIYKRKGRRQRSSSCPVQPHLTRSNCIHISEPADLDFVAETLELDYQSPKIVHGNNRIFSVASELDSLTTIENKNCAECRKMAVEDHLEIDHFNEHQNMLKERNVDSLQSRPKEYLDALDIISTNKDLLVKLLQDPGSPLAHHFQNRQALSAKRGFLGKAETFPLQGSPGRIGSISSRFKNIHEAEPRVEEIAGISSNTSSLGSVKLQDNQGETYVVNKSFKDLRKKIKHVLKENRKDMHRIAMDAVMDKIPQGNKIINGEENADCSKEPPSRNKNKLWQHQMRRTSSLDDSYWRMYETSPNREAKHQTSKGLKTRAKEGGLLPKSFSRIRSLPDLKSLDNQNDEYSDAFSSGNPVKAALDSDVGIEYSFDGQKSLDFLVGSEDHELRIEASMENTIVQQNSIDLGATNDSTTDKAALTSTKDVEEPILLSSQMDDHGSLTDKAAETYPVLLDGLAINLSKKTEEPDMVPLEASKTENVELLDEHLTSELSHLEVAAKDQAEFSYVKDVLELSGFSRNAFLKTWHSDEQPVDPLVYEEVEGCCLVLDPDCRGNAVDGNCDHILLFDLINEVLMEIYARSYSYCPFALSFLSHISPMPSGPHVLKEVWGLISWYLSLTPEVDPTVDDVVASDLAKSDGWMNLQFDAECVGIELEDLIFDDLLKELILEADFTYWAYLYSLCT